MRLVLPLAVLAVALVGLALAPLLRPAPPALGDADVRAIVAEVLAERDAKAAAAEPAKMNTPPMDVATLGPMIDSYLMDNPRILQRMSDALNSEIKLAQAAETRDLIGKYREAIFNDPDRIVVGNPDGDVTLVEMFDYNCSYCRGALPDLAALIAEDPNLRVVLKEFPILSQESVDAARVAVVVSRQPVDYWAFHQKLFTSRGQVDEAVALKAAADLGLNPGMLKLDLQSDKVTSVIQKSYDIAKGLNISGTPTYIIGDELIPGAVPIDQLRTRIKNMRACGKTACEG